VRSRRGTTRRSIATEVGRRVLVVWLGALIAHAPADPAWHVPALVAAAAIMEVGDILSCPLVLAPLSGEPLLRIIANVAREAYLLEGAQYLIGLLGALAVTRQLWAMALLAIPTTLLYLAFRALGQAERAQQMAEEAVRMRDDFLLAGSHDLRTPLTVVLGRIELLQAALEAGRTPNAETLRRQLRASQQAALRMYSTVEEMTDLVHLQLGKTRALQLAPVDLGALVQETIAVVVGASSAGHAPIVVSGATSVVIEGDRARLGRVLENIIGNAVKYSPEATPIEIDLTAEAEWVIMTVRDQGVGIPTSEIPRVFEPFYRASTAAGIPGSGIGLAGARSIVEQHGGRITVESAAGVGTTVTILLPRRQER
jgi:signal transduction histidine kinase